MITEGSSALKLLLNPKRAEMEAYLSSEGGYWFLNDIWRADANAYVTAGIGPVRNQAVSVVDFSSFQNEELKLEMKYFLLYGLKHKWRTPFYLQNIQKTAVRLVGERMGSDPWISSFAQYEDDETDDPGENERDAPRNHYRRLRREVISFFREFYDEREETEKDVWHALRIPGVKLSAAMKREQPTLKFSEIPEDYRSSVKRFMKRLIIRRSWSYCRETLMYIRYFFRAFYEHGYGDGFLEKLTRQDVENYLCWVADDYENRNATFPVKPFLLSGAGWTISRYQSIRRHRSKV